MKERKQASNRESSLAGRPAFLIGKRLYLRPLEPGDLELFYPWFNNPELRQFIQMPFPVSREQEREFIENAMRGADQVTLAIVLTRGDRLIGDVFISPPDRIHRKASLGIALADPSAWSQGYGTEALELIMEYAFNTLNLHRLELHVFSFNRRAAACYLKLGFKEEGRSREAHFSGGKYHDIIHMGLLRKEWQSRRPA